MRTSKIILYFSLLIVFISSCKEETRDGLQGAPDKAKVAVIQLASPVRVGSSNLSQLPLAYFFSIDGKQELSQPIIANRTTGYILLEPGARTLTFDTVFAVTNVNNLRPRATVKTISINALANTFYSVYLSGKVQTPGDLVTVDDLTRPAAGKAKIRFVNLSPDSPALDFAGAAATTTGTRPVLIGNRTYNTSSDFITVDVANDGQFFAFELRNAGSTTVVPTQSRTNEIVPQIGQVSFSTVQSFTQLLEAGKIYTFIARGYVNPTTGGAPVPPSTLSQPVPALSVTGVINLNF